MSIVDKTSRTTQIRLDAETRDDLSKRLTPLLQGRQTEGAVAALVAASTEAFRDALPIDVLETLEQWREGGAVALRMGNLPEQTWGPTPSDGYTTDRSFELSNLVTFGVLGVAGIAPVSYDAVCFLHTSP